MPIDILMPTMRKRISLALGLFVMLFLSLDGLAQPHAGPMDVKRFQILRRAAQNSANGYWAKVAYQEYINGLLEGLMDKEGQTFCLPVQITRGRVDDVFAQLTIEVEAATRDARLSEYVSVLALKHFKKKYPC